MTIASVAPRTTYFTLGVEILNRNYQRNKLRLNNNTVFSVHVIKIQVLTNSVDLIKPVDANIMI